MCTHEALQARCNQAEIKRYFKVSIADVERTMIELEADDALASEIK